MQCSWQAFYCDALFAVDTFKESRHALRFAGAPHKKAFIKAPMNLLGAWVMANSYCKTYCKKLIVVTDSFAIAPYYIGLVMEAPPPELPPVVSTKLPSYMNSMACEYERHCIDNRHVVFLCVLQLLYGDTYLTSHSLHIFNQPSKLFSQQMWPTFTLLPIPLWM